MNALKKPSLTHAQRSERTSLKCQPIVQGGLVYLIKHCAKPQMVYLAHTKNEKHSFTRAGSVCYTVSACQANQTVTRAYLALGLIQPIPNTWVRRSEKVMFVNCYLIWWRTIHLFSFRCHDLASFTAHANHFPQESPHPWLKSCK